MICSAWLIFTITLYMTVHLLQCRLLDAHRSRSALNRMEFMYHYKDKHSCQRECIEGDTRTCTYDFHIEWYYTMSKACYDCPFNVTDCGRLHCIPADGVKRAITVVNRQLPGPAVDVCVGDHVIVNLHNGLMEESTSIHWHGHHQVDSPYMDGVPHLTQCPVPPRSTFRYKFNADSPGTHFWHSHTGSQRGDGSFGAFIIRKPRPREVHAPLYDFDLPEHIMLITDWSHVLGVEMFNAHHHADGDNKPPTILMNGKGRFKEFRSNATVTYTPMEVFTVKQGHSYRFRIINAGYLNCPIELSIANHTLTAINSDGGDIKPISVGSIVSYAGERWDFILNATHHVGNYWIKMRGLMDCDERFTSAYQTAVLRYEGAPDESPAGEVDYDATRTSGTVLNPLNTPSRQAKSTLISELSTVHSASSDVRLQDRANLTFYISYDFYEIDNPHFHLSTLYGFDEVKRLEKVRTPQLNHLSFRFPTFPLLSQRDQIDESTFCSNLTTDRCADSYCECTNVVNVPLESVVELIIIDEGVAYDANHPFHLHGHPFRVVAMERVAKNITRQDVIDMDAKGLIRRNLKDAPLKDTVTVPDGGFTIIRFHATNPGYWLFHCHIEFHVETGMALVFKVGEHEDMAPVPKDFPTCGDYYNVDSVEDEDNEIGEIGEKKEVTTQGSVAGDEIIPGSDDLDKKVQYEVMPTDDVRVNTSDEHVDIVHGVNTTPEHAHTSHSHVNTNGERNIHGHNTTRVGPNTTLTSHKGHSHSPHIPLRPNTATNHANPATADSVYEGNKSKDKVKYIQNERTKSPANKLDNSGIVVNPTYDVVNDNNNEDNDLNTFVPDGSILSDIVPDGSIPEEPYQTEVESNDIPIRTAHKEELNDNILSRIFRSTPGSSDRGSVMMRPASLVLAAISIVIILAVIIFALYKACS
ncbi:laccase [Diaphorina citri]|uniref:Laccase n=1 Tax=Diaphorina citri TaxID=121845 RepID=A0A1S3DUG6_DIACI|nr:laccase [Diaphorina citri]